MKPKSLLSVCAVAMMLTTTAFALTLENEVTSAYVREHSADFTVSGVKSADGAIKFTITHNVPTPMYHVAHLAISHQGKLVATSDTPSFGKKQDNKFYFSLSPEDVGESKFSLSDSALDSTGQVPIPGTVIHNVQLADFVPRELLK